MSDRPTIEGMAAETAGRLMKESIQFARQAIEKRPYLDTPTEAVLIATHALIAKLDSMETSHLDAMRGLRESLDSLSERIDRLQS